jgi:sugar transferase EpsL
MDLTKRSCDVIGALVLLILLSPVLLVLGVAGLAALGRPILFRQVRPGLEARPFELIKFRTMLETRDAGGSLLPNQQRLTRYGRFLRAASLDELPELWNVVRGDMSLVGPRPLLMEYLPLYTPRQARRHEVRPGITGWAQVNGRNLVPWEERFEMDVWYVDNRSLWLDVRILFMTIGRTFSRHGISTPGRSTIDRFGT